ncbi:MAG TPA: XRE family transcriptional regulator [Gammaproteobacteria bacterium]|nr:XRE family transcriptional regulator [Gammaproteobacteria bacterium]HIN18839.1 XRE family transcriptional regulator [Gammaproteobacteria bacterium]
MSKTSTENDKRIAARFSRLWAKKRLEMSMTQEQLAGALGISQSAVSQMLSCKMLISTEMVMKIAVVLGESPTSIDPAYFKRFDMNRSEMIGFLALELMKLKPSERNKIMQETRRMDKRDNKRQSRIVT